jgi:hypothetical protein
MAKRLSIRVSVRTLDPQNENQQIAEVAQWDISLKPLSEEELIIPNLVMDANTYGVVSEGAVTIRCSAVSLKDQAGYEKGDKLGKHSIIFTIVTNQDLEYLKTQVL